MDLSREKPVKYLDTRMPGTRARLQKDADRIRATPEFLEWYKRQKAIEAKQGTQIPQAPQFYDPPGPVGEHELAYVDPAEIEMLEQMRQGGPVEFHGIDAYPSGNYTGGSIGTNRTGNYSTTSARTSSTIGGNAQSGGLAPRSSGATAPRSTPTGGLSIGGQRAPSRSAPAGNAQSGGFQGGFRGPTGPQGQARSNFAGGNRPSAMGGGFGVRGSSGFRGPTGPQGQARSNFAGSGIGNSLTGAQSLAGGFGGLTRSFKGTTALSRPSPDWGAYGQPRQVNAQQRMRDDLNAALGGRQLNLNPKFGDALYRAELDASKRGILTKQMDMRKPFAFKDSLGRTEEDAAQNKANAIQGPYTWKGVTYRPTKGKIVAAGPRTSPHVFGLAADFEPGPLRNFMRSPATLAKYGLETLPGGIDKPHVQLAGTRGLIRTGKVAQVQQGKPLSVTRYAGLPSKKPTISNEPTGTMSLANLTRTAIPRAKPARTISNEAAKADRTTPGIAVTIAALGGVKPRQAPARAVPKPTPSPFQARKGFFYGDELDRARRQQAPFEDNRAPTGRTPGNEMVGAQQIATQPSVAAQRIAELERSNALARAQRHITLERRGVRPAAPSAAALASRQGIASPAQRFNMARLAPSTGDPIDYEGDRPSIGMPTNIQPEPPPLRERFISGKRRSAKRNPNRGRRMGGDREMMVQAILRRIMGPEREGTRF